MITPHCHILQATDKKNMTPIHLACIYGHADIVQLLVQAGCSIYCKDDDSSTPLHMAAAEGNLEVSIV